MKTLFSYSLKIAIVLSLSSLSCFVASSASAATPQEVLETLYNEATAPASAEDFPFVNLDNQTIGYKNICITLYSDQSFANSNVGVYRVTTPSQGPLFPRKTTEKLYFSGSGSAYLFGFDQTVSEVNSKDLIITNPIYATITNNVTGGIDSVEAKFFARKSGDYVAYKIQVNYPPASQQVNYGYCFPVDKALF